MCVFVFSQIKQIPQIEFCEHGQISLKAIDSQYVTLNYLDPQLQVKSQYIHFDGDDKADFSKVWKYYAYTKAKQLNLKIHSSLSVSLKEVFSILNHLKAQQSFVSERINIWTRLLNFGTKKDLTKPFSDRIKFNFDKSDSKVKFALKTAPHSFSYTLSDYEFSVEVNKTLKGTENICLEKRNPID